MTTTTKEPFSIDIVLRHPSYEQESISEALSIKPQGCWGEGQRLGKLRANWTFFYACLQKGDYAADFEGALAKVVLFLEKNATFWTDFMSGQGEVELILSHTFLEAAGQADLCSELHLEPVFLGHLSARGIGLRVQGWRG